MRKERVRWRSVRFIAGAYTGTLNAVALGIAEEGYELQVEPHAEAINRSDVFGDMMIDAVYRGQDYFLQADFMEYKAGPTAAAFPFGALGVQGVIGRLYSDIATSLVLTATAGTPAAATPATLTASKTILAPNWNVNAAFHSRLRKLPVRFCLLAFDSGGGVMKNLTTT